MGDLLVLLILLILILGFLAIVLGLIFLVLFGGWKLLFGKSKKKGKTSGVSTPPQVQPREPSTASPGRIQNALPPFPGIRQPPEDLKPGIYVFGHIWHWDGSQWHHESASTIEPVTGLWGNAQIVTAACWEQLWDKEQGPWTQSLFDGPRFFGTWGDLQQTVYAVGVRGTILSRPIHQTEWQRNSTPTQNTLNAVWGRESETKAQQIFAVGFKNTILISSGNGNWTEEISPVASDLNGVGGDQNNVYVVGTNGTILRRNQGGNWVSELIETKENFASVWGAGQGAVYAVTSSGSIYHSRGDGQWTQQLKQSSQLTAVWGLSAHEIYAVGLRGKILGSNGNGEWIDMSGSSSLTITTIWGRSGDELWIGGDQMYDIKEDGTSPPMENLEVVAQTPT